MKPLGIIRKIDDLGRLVIPKELRKSIGWEDNSPIEMFCGNKQEVILRKYEPGCIFCGESKNLMTYSDKNVCKQCIETMFFHMKQSESWSNKR